MQGPPQRQAVSKLEGAGTVHSEKTCPCGLFHAGRFVALLFERNAAS